MITLKKAVPRVNYYNQDFVDVYVRSWNMIDDCWAKGNSSNNFQPIYFSMLGRGEINQLEACFSPFYLVYSNRVYPAQSSLDNFYDKQEPNGAIRGQYSTITGEAILTEDNPQGLLPPLFALSEFDLYHKIGAKKRIKDVLPTLERYFAFIDSVAFDASMGLYSVPLAATGMASPARQGVKYPIDYNCQQAINALYMAHLGDILNDKELAFTYKKRYFMLKTKINTLMWDEQTSFYYDLDDHGTKCNVKTIAAYWALLAEILNKENSDKFIAHLSDKEAFGTPNPFPSLAANEPLFNPLGGYYCGSVHPELTYMVIKGLEKYGKFEFAREVAVRHLYYILDTFHPEADHKGSFWSGYQPMKDGPALNITGLNAMESDYIVMAALITITLMIENIVGLFISLPRKTVDWVVPTLELMGIEALSLKRNEISILSAKNSRGSWEIRLESEKLYYFTVDLLNVKKKTLPIPSGRCSMLLDKL